MQLPPALMQLQCVISLITNNQPTLCLVWDLNRPRDQTPKLKGSDQVTVLLLHLAGQQDRVCHVDRRTR